MNIKTKTLDTIAGFWYNYYTTNNYNMSVSEVWKSVNNYEGLYEISNLGKVKSVKFYKHLIRKSSINFNGYCILGLTKKGKYKSFRVHRLVAQAFLGLDISDSKVYACHINDIKNDNRAENLFLGSHNDNIQDAVKKGRIGKYENHSRAKLKNEDIPKIMELLKQKVKQSKIAKQFNVCSHVISNIKTGRSWKGIN